MAKKDINANVYSSNRIVAHLAQTTGIDSETCRKIFETTFWIINKKIMEGKTVQVADFGTFRLKHMEKRMSCYDKILFPNEYQISEEHYKVSFLAYEDVKRRAQRLLNKKKKKAEEAANDDSRTE